jgi:hypothetical protein
MLDERESSEEFSIMGRKQFEIVNLESSRKLRRQTHTQKIRTMIVLENHDFHVL